MTNSNAIKPLKAVLRPTTFIQSVRLNNRTGLDITLACETFQMTGSFKFRAAYNVASSVPQDHIITASSGNFGQAIAYACRLLGKRCTVVMPDTSAQVKIEAVKEFGGEVDLIETSSQSRSQRVAELAGQFPQAYIASPYDDELVIAGNATLGEELAAVVPQFDAVLVPVGGGGLSAGIIKGIALAGKSDAIYVFGVEPALANDCARSLKSGSIETNASESTTIADGVRTLSIGKHNWELIRQGMSDVIEVSEEGIAESLRLLFHLANLKAEPTGAVSLAGAICRQDLFKGKRICCVVSGGNVDLPVFEAIMCKS
jgi:threonine dehydratase